MSKQLAQLKNKIVVDSNANITDYQFNQNANQLAISDSEGHIFIHRKVGQGYIKQTKFIADTGAIWSIAWGPEKFGKILAIGTFKKKVAIYQQRNNQWVEVAYHYLHEGSVNCVCWAPEEYGLKLYAGGSDGKVSILQLRGNAWSTTQFQAHQWQINSLAVQPLALNDSGKGLEHCYPRIATVSKDHNIKIWRHRTQNEEGQDSITSLFKQQKDYITIVTNSSHKELIRSIIFRPRWSDQKDRQFQLISCSQNGIVKLFTYEKNSLIDETIILQIESPINRISQSITGNLLMVSAGQLNSEQNYIYELKEKQAKLIKKWDVL